jgi:hypothetical protein
MADEPEEADRRTESKRQMPKTPDFSGEKWGATRKTSPFLLDDFSSRAADTTTKP